MWTMISTVKYGTSVQRLSCRLEPTLAIKAVKVKQLSCKIVFLHWTGHDFDWRYLCQLSENDGTKKLLGTWTLSRQLISNLRVVSLRNPQVWLLVHRRCGGTAAAVRYSNQKTACRRISAGSGWRIITLISKSQQKNDVNEVTTLVFILEDAINMVAPFYLRTVGENNRDLCNFIWADSIKRFRGRRTKTVVT